MSEFKYKVGDRVQIKSLDWYNDNKDEHGYVPCREYDFVPEMLDFCGKILTIDVDFEDETYLMKEDIDGFVFTSEMIECLVEEEIKNWADVSIPDDPFTVTYGSPSMNDSMNKNNINNGIIILPEGYIFKDENGNVINATKIVLEKKKKEYPKTYEECLKVLGYEDIATHCIFHNEADEKLFNTLYDLKVCRDAYWKIAGDEMGLGKSWEPDWREERYIMYWNQDDIIGGYREAGCIEHHIFEFPTPEMRDAFKENFDPDIKICKEFL